MFNLVNILSRRGEEILTSWLGSSTVELLQALDLGSPSPITLARLIVKRYSEIGVILDNRLRNALIKSLKKDEAESLCVLLGLNGPNPWDLLSKSRLTRTGKKTKDWFEAFGVEDIGDGAEEITKKVKPFTECTPEYALFDHQITAVRETMDILHGDNCRVILHMPTGAGKTRTAMNIIATLLRNELPPKVIVIWLAHSEELCEQAASEFEKAWTHLGCRKFPVVRHFGSTRTENLETIDDGFVVMSLSLAYQTSLNNDRTFFSLGKKTKLVIMDEAHQAIAETYQHVLNILAPSKNVYLLGLTATPGRKYFEVDEDIRLAAFFQKNKVTLKIDGYDSPIDYLRAEGYLSTVTTDPIIYENKSGKLSQKELQSLESGLDLSQKALREIGNDATRNLLIILRILEEVQMGNKIIVFACSVEHAEVLETIINLKGVNAVSVTGNTNPTIRRNALEQFKNGNSLNVLLSCDVLTTGFDAPKANVAICNSHLLAGLFV
jgi:DNA repair protein RadD